MADSKKSSDGTASKSHQQDKTTIAEKTTAAIANDKAASATAPPVPKQQKKPPPKPNLDDSDDDSFSRARCLMFFPTSGHMGFETIKTSNELPSIETVREMIAYETRIRLSESIQDLIDAYHKDEAAITCILNLIQQYVVEHFGYYDVNALRTALYRFPDEPAVKEAFYVKHNKVTQGLVQQNECIRDIDLYTSEGSSTTLFSNIPAGQPLVLLAGSTS
ncbi:hypothetical protein I4U23_015282 [Adineta vaga]|nr:hypothetical protein I4U23_015282 [Adineta vaga]